jgi:hypothetical protein
MRPTDRMDLISRIGRESQARFTYGQIDEFLAAYKLKGPANIDYNSKWRYSREALKDVDSDLLLKIAEDLDMEARAGHAGLATPPRNWAKTTEFRLFISHITKHKDKATRLKECLVLLCHKRVALCWSRLRRQHGHRGRRFASATAMMCRRVDIDDGEWRSGRSGGAARAEVVLGLWGLARERADEGC